MIFVALLYSQFDLNERIELDPQTTLAPLGYQGLRGIGNGCMAVGGFKFAYVQRNVAQPIHPLANIGFTDTNVKTFLEFFHL